MIRAEHISKVYGSGENEVRALDDISFTVEKGEFIAITGPSGSGKSTLLHILGGVDYPTSGKVYVNDVDVYAQSEEKLAIFRRREVGLIYQFYNLIPTLTVEKNIQMPLTLDKKKPNQEYFDQVVRSLGMEEKLSALPNQLSGGQQQRVAIARALALQPDILCFDEPTSALDPELTGEVLKVIRSLADRKTTMIIVTHEMAFARDVSDQLIFMDEGVIVEQGDPRQVIDHPQEERTKQFLTRYAQG